MAHVSNSSRFTGPAGGLTADKGDTPVAPPADTGFPTSDLSILRGTKVLLADADAASRTATVVLLESVGMLTDIVGDGMAAVELVAATHYEIVLMDIGMPMTDGIAATRLIRERMKAHELPIVGMTANAIHSLETECLVAGMNDLITKPVGCCQLYSVIHKWVTGLGDAYLLDAAFGKAMAGRDIRLPDEIKGIDIRAGLRRMAGMRALYLDNLKDFAEQQEGIVERIRAAVLAGEMETAGREAHTFKGQAGMIEASELRDLAITIETTLAAGDVEGCKTLLDRLDIVIVPILAAIRAGTENAAAAMPGSLGHA